MGHDTQEFDGDVSMVDRKMFIKNLKLILVINFF